MVEIRDHLGVLEAGNQIQQKGPMHTFRAYNTSGRAQMDQYLKGYCLKEFPQVLIELLAADDSGRGKSLSLVMYPLVSLPDSSGWLQVRHHTDGPGSTPSHKTKLKDMNMKRGL